MDEGKLEEVAERIGRLADTADNYLQWGSVPAVDHVRADAMKNGLEVISTELKALYAELTGNDVWGE